MVDHDRSSYAEAIEYAVDTTMVQEDRMTVRELIQLLAERAEELDKVAYSIYYGTAPLKYSTSGNSQRPL